MQKIYHIISIILNKIKKLKKPKNERINGYKKIPIIIPRTRTIINWLIFRWDKTRSEKLLWEHIKKPSI